MEIESNVERFRRAFCILMETPLLVMDLAITEGIKIEAIIGHDGDKHTIKELQVSTFDRPE